MSHAAIIETIARLHIDISFRRAFLEDPGRAMGAVDHLSEQERRGLAALSKRDVELLGRAFDYHRQARLVEHLGWADAAKRPDVQQLIERYAEACPPPLLNRQEAIGFCRYIEAIAPPPEAPYLAEIGRYERLRIGVAWGLESAGDEPLRFAYAIHEILDALSAPGWPCAPAKETFYTFTKVPGIPATLVRPALPRA